MQKQPGIGEYANVEVISSTERAYANTLPKASSDAYSKYAVQFRIVSHKKNIIVPGSPVPRHLEDATQCSPTAQSEELERTYANTLPR